MIELGDNDVEVVMSFTGTGLRMESGGKEIGNWDKAAYDLVSESDGSYVLHAESQALRFRPASPDEFESALANALRAPAPQGVSRRERRQSRPAEDIEVGPRPRLLTVLLFWLLVVATLAMGTWAVISLTG